MPLHHGMTVPVVRRCPDGHYRRVIFDLAAFIADYPEQVYLSGVVQGWCPRFVIPSLWIEIWMNINQKINRCTAFSSDLDGLSGRRTRKFTKDLIDELDSKALWDGYGIDSDILVFFHFGVRHSDLTNSF
jgi:hypothetical protein